MMLSLPALDSDGLTTAAFWDHRGRDGTVKEAQ